MRFPQLLLSAVKFDLEHLKCNCITGADASHECIGHLLCCCSKHMVLMAWRRLSRVSSSTVTLGEVCLQLEDAHETADSGGQPAGRPMSRSSSVHYDEPSP